MFLIIAVGGFVAFLVQYGQMWNEIYDKDVERLRSRYHISSLTGTCGILTCFFVFYLTFGSIESETLLILSSSIFLLSIFLWAMGKRFSHIVRRLNEHSKDLELRILKRTCELEHTNKKLSFNYNILQKTQEQLLYNSKMSAIEEMATGVAHEINNPLTIIQGNASSIISLHKKGKLSDEQLLACMDKINNTTERVSEVINKLRNISDFRSKDIQEICPVKKIIKQTLIICEEGLRGDQIQVNVPYIDDGIMIECNSVKLSQVLLNLVYNARTAIGELKEKWIKIEVMIESDEKKYSCLDFVAQHDGSNMDDKKVCITVTDSGEGISKDDRHKIFEAFYKKDNTTDGAGLGLSVSRAIVDAHRGNMYLEEDSKNTQFVISIPLKDVA